MNEVDSFLRDISASRGFQRDYITPGEYLIREAGSRIRHDYLDGRVYPVDPGGVVHDQVVSRVAATLRAAAGPCEVHSMDMKVRLAGQNCFYYPDLMVVCAPDSGDPEYRTSPCLLAEVVTRSSANTDRREKWLGYRELPSLSYYLLPSADGSRFSYYRREGQRDWRFFEVYPGQSVEISCGPLHCRLDWGRIYGNGLLEVSRPVWAGA